MDRLREIADHVCECGLCGAPIDDRTALFDGWLKESMERCAKLDFQFVYKEGWAGALYDIMARSDAWKKQQKRLEV